MAPAIQLSLVSTSSSLVKRFAFAEGDPAIMLGRASKSRNEKVTVDNGLFDSSIMSRHHAELSYDGGKKVLVRDLGSTHGTHVLPALGVDSLSVDNEGVLLGDGDIVTFGRTVSRSDSEGEDSDDREIIEPLSFTVTYEPVATKINSTYSVRDALFDVGDDLDHPVDLDDLSVDVEVEASRKASQIFTDLDALWDVDQADLGPTPPPEITEDVEESVIIVDDGEMEVDAPDGFDAFEEAVPGLVPSQYSSDNDSNSDHELPSPPRMPASYRPRRKAPSIDIDLSRDASPALSSHGSWRGPADVQEIRLSALRDEYEPEEAISREGNKERAHSVAEDSTATSESESEDEIEDEVPLVSPATLLHTFTAPVEEPPERQVAPTASRKRSFDEVDAKSLGTSAPDASRPLKRLRKVMEYGAVASLGAIVGAVGTVFALANMDGEF